MTDEQILGGDCPILDIVIGSNFQVFGLEQLGYTVLYDAQYTEGNYLAFTKHDLRSFIQYKFGTPLIKAGLSYGGTPCYGFNRDRLILYEYQMDLMQFLIEKESPIWQCPQYEWRNRTYDSRYIEIGEISLYQLQKDNGVLDEIDKLVPLASLSPSDKAFGIESRKGVGLKFFTQALYIWSISCEGDDSSAKFYETLQGLSHYFLTHEEQLAQQYNIFLEPAPPEHILWTVLALQFCLIGYFLINYLVFTFQTVFQPQIKDSRRLLGRQKRKHCLCMLPLFLGALVCEFLTIWLAKNSLNYNKMWGDALKDRDDRYDCTFGALRIDPTTDENVASITMLSYVISGTVVQIIGTFSQFYGHFKVMMNWYELNPKDGHRVARSISVGLPVDNVIKSQRGTIMGHVVPEADREVTPLPLAFTKQSSVTATPVGFTHPVDLRESAGTKSRKPFASEPFTDIKELPQESPTQSQTGKAAIQLNKKAGRRKVFRISSSPPIIKEASKVDINDLEGQNEDNSRNDNAFVSAVLAQGNSTAAMLGSKQKAKIHILPMRTVTDSIIEAENDYRPAERINDSELDSIYDNNDNDYNNDDGRSKEDYDTSAIRVYSARDGIADTRLPGSKAPSPRARASTTTPSAWIGEMPNEIL